MKTFKTVDDILSSDIFSEREYTNRVLKSTQIEQMIYDDLRTDSGLPEIERQNRNRLKSFSELANDVFQSIYGIYPKFNDDRDMSAQARLVNKRILNGLMADDKYISVKKICEGKELAAIAATEEFIQSVADDLDSFLPDDKNDVLETLKKDREQLTQKLLDIVGGINKLSGDSRRKAEKRASELANRINSKREQAEMYENILKNNMQKRDAAVRTAVRDAAIAAKEKAEDVVYQLIAWGDGDSQLRKNELNGEVLKRCAGSQKLRYIAKFLGRYKELLNSKRISGYAYGRGEKYDIGLGNNLSRTLTSDLSMLASPALVPLFARKYRNKSLKEYRRREPEYKGKGDVIVCLDESSSTFGENSAYGMALAMVLYELCRVNHTNFALVHFAKDTKTDFFPKDELVSGKRLMSCAETFLSGGTSFDNAVKGALDVAVKMDKPDIVFITDGECSLSDNVQTELEKFKAGTGAKLTGILLDKGNCFEFSLAQFSDKVYRTSELLKETIAEKLIEEGV